MEKNRIFYSGKDEKYGVTIQGKRYIVKPGSNQRKLMKIYAEFVASRVYHHLGWAAQNVSLITCHDSPAALLEDFLPKDAYFVPFGSLIEENYDVDNGDVSYSYENIKRIIFSHPRIADSSRTLQYFWNIYLVDYLIGGGGRNASNWGFIGHGEMLSPAPAFDNSSSFYYKEYAGQPFTGPEQMLSPRMTFCGTRKPRLDIILSRKYPECSISAGHVLRNFSPRELSQEVHYSGIPEPLVTGWFMKILQHNFTQLQQGWYYAQE